MALVMVHGAHLVLAAHVEVALTPTARVASPVFLAYADPSAPAVRYRWWGCVSCQ